MIDTDDVRAAAARIHGRIRQTPVLSADESLWFKLEHTQHTGSFKTRGMLNRLLAAASRGDLPAAGIITASGGNAGLAAAYAARELQVPATVYVPVTAPAVKLANLANLGARVEQVGAEYADAYESAVADASRTGALFCHAYDDPDMVAGNGTVGLELLDQIPHGFDTVLVAVGGGGLLAGVTGALHGHARTVAVEPVNCAALNAALQAGKPVQVPVSGIAADSLGARQVGHIAYEVAAAAKVSSVLVDDNSISAARRRLWQDYRIIVEHGTAAAYAAVTCGAYQRMPGERVVVLLCGANTDPTDLALA